MKTLNVYSNGQWQEVVGSPAGLEAYYTIVQTDAAITASREECAADLNAVQTQVLFAIEETGKQTQAKIDLKADKADVTLLQTQTQAIFDSIYTRAECDGRYARLDNKDQVVLARGFVSTVYAFGDTLDPEVAIKAKLIDGAIRLVFTPGGNKQEVVAFQSDAAADLSAYAKLQDNQQPLLAKTVVSQAYGFGDTLLPSVALAYTDTGEGYGNRLVLNIGLTNEYLVYASDIEAVKSRVDALESKAAPVVDLTDYAKTEWVVAWNTSNHYTKSESDARYYTQRQTDDRFMRITDAFSKADFDNQMALFLYSRKQVDDKLTAISPLGSPSINDPALADFKKSVLDAVKLMLVGGAKMPPPDIDWTPIIRMDGTRETVSTEIQARMLGGFIEFKGTLTFLAGTAEWVPLRLPPQFPLAEIDANYPLAMRLVGTAVTYGFCTASSKSRDIKVSPGAKSNEANFSGIRWKAAY
jgi:hypothetical protein